MEAQRQEEILREKNPLYCFPAVLYNAVRRKLDPMLKTFGITEESKVPTVTTSLFCFVSQGEITDSGPGWKIHKRDDEASGKPPMCKIRLISDKDEISTKAGEILEKEVKSIWRRIGVLELQTLAHARLVKENLENLESRGSDLFCELVEMASPCRLVIGGALVLLSTHNLKLSW